ncbi:MAG: OsmC family protein [Gemmatimonadota bacterium]|nr:OsmC family protein [Gemmatimonadota bacterium]MDE2984955.1 OsmC family protein [Gemmatimonadota bacterium]
MEVRGIPMDNDAIRVEAEGVKEVVDRMVVLTKIHAHYTIRLPEGAPREKVDRALATHVAKCPTARSLEGAVKVTWSADVAGG